MVENTVKPTVEIGRFNHLTVIRQSEKGLHFDGGEFGDIVLPARISSSNSQESKPGESLEVFIYTDTNDRLTATTEAPLACVGEFAWLKVVSVNDIGAFLDWGLPKDLFLPYGEQKYLPEVGKRVMVKVLLHERTNRVIASTRVDSFVKDEAYNLKAGQAVDLLIADKTELGFKAIVENQFWGVLYSNEIYEKINKGQRIKGYIKRIRDDRKIDLTLSQPGYGKISALADQIIEALEEHDGFLMITDKSSPEVINNVFKVSKKAYKQAIGALYKQRRIVLEEKGIRLVD